MKYLFILLTCLALENTACSKKENCKTVTITQSGTLCSNWGIKVNNQAYPSTTIPVAYQQEGLQVCADYEFYEDFRSCVCCGGTWAKIISIRLPHD